MNAPLRLVHSRPNSRERRTRSRVREIAYVVLPVVNEAAATLRPKRGETIRQFVDRSGWEARGLPLICVSTAKDKAVPVLRRDWDRKIRARDRIVFFARPAGGGGGAAGSRQIGALVAMVALIAFASFLTGPGGLGLGATLAESIGLFSATTWASISSAIIIGAGSLLINHFLMPKTPKDEDPGTLYSASLSGNTAKPQQTIPVQYGRLKFTPDFSAPPWQDFIDQEQHFQALYTIGAGEYQIHEIGVSETPIWNENTGISPGFPGFQYEIVPPDQPVTLFPVNVITAPNISGQEFPDPYSYQDPGPGGETSGTNWVGPFVLNPAGTSGSEIAVDLVFGGGCYYQDDQGSIKPAFQDLQVQYRYVDDAGVPIGGPGAPFFTIISARLQFATNKPLRITKKAILPSPGRIEIRAGVQQFQFRNPGTNVLSWVAARMIIGGGNSRPNVTQLAIRVKGDKQFSGYSSQSVYVIATRKIPVWNGSGFVQQATRNPVWAYVDIWCNSVYGAGLSSQKIDLLTLNAEALAADERGDCFNYRFTNRVSVLEALETAARVIIAKPQIVWDTLSIIRDQPREIPKLMLTDLEIVRGSTQIVYPLLAADSADGTVVEYLEEQTWKTADAPSNDDINTLINPARVQIPGVTVRKQAMAISRYMALSNQYRRKTLTVDVEFEGQMLFFGELVCLSTELPQTWGQTLVVVDYDPLTRRMEFNVPPNWNDDASVHYARIRRRNGRPFGPVKIARGADDFEGILDGNDLATVQTQQGITIVQALAREPGDQPVSCSFSDGQPREFLGLVSGVRSSDDGKFRLDLAAYAPEVYQGLDAPVPPLPPPPTVIVPRFPGLIVGLNATLTQIGALLQMSASWAIDLGSDRYQAQATITGLTIDGEPTEDVWTTLYSGVEAAFIVSGLPNNNYKLRVRGVRATDAGEIDGEWSEIGVETPGLDLTPHRLNYQIDYVDLSQSLFDASFTGANRALSDAMVASLGEALERKQQDSVLATSNAYILEEQTVITGTLGSLALRLEQVSAQSVDGLAQGSIRFAAQSSPVSGTLASYELQLSATGPNGAFSFAGMRVEAGNDGTSRIVMSANQFWVQNPALKVNVFGTHPDGSLILQGVTRVASSIVSVDVTGTGAPIMEQNFVQGYIVISD